jgi:hypothetical protein
MTSLPEPPDYPDKRVQIPDTFTGGIRMTTAGRVQARKLGEARRKMAERTVAVEDSRIILRFAGEPDLVALVRSIPGRSYDGVTKANSFPLTSAQAVLALAREHDFTIPDELVGLAAQSPSAEKVDPDPSYVKVEKDALVVHFPYDDDVYESFIAMAGRTNARWNKEAQQWVVHPRITDRLLGWARARDFDIAPELATGANPEPPPSTRKTVAPRPFIPGLAPDRIPRPHEELAVSRILRTRRILLADDRAVDMRFEALAGLAAADAFPALIVTSESGRYGWMESLRAFPSLLGPRGEGTAAVHVVTYKALANLLSESPDVRNLAQTGLVLDNVELLASGRPIAHCPECAVAVGPGGSNCAGGHHFDAPVWRYSDPLTDAAIRMAWLVPNDGVVIGIADPRLLNEPARLVNPLTALGWMRSFGGTATFLHDFAGARKVDGRWVLDSHPPGPELRTRLAETCAVARTREEVAAELGEVTVRTVSVLAARDVARQYERDEVATLNSLRARFPVAGGRDEIWRHRESLVPELGRLSDAAAEAAFDEGCDYVRDLLDRASDRRIVCVVESPDRRRLLGDRLGHRGIVVDGSPGQGFTATMIRRYSTESGVALVVDGEGVRRLSSLEGARDVVAFDPITDPSRYVDLCEACYDPGTPRGGAIVWQLAAQHTVAPEIARWVAPRIPVQARVATHEGEAELAAELISVRMFPTPDVVRAPTDVAGRADISVTEIPAPAASATPKMRL